MAAEDIVISWFSNVKEKLHPVHTPLLDVLQEIKEGTGDLKASIASIRKAPDEETRQKLKIKTLPVFCPSGTFTSREDAAVIDFSGIVCLDLDHVLNKDAVISTVKSTPYVLAAFESPSDGLKVLCLVKLNEDDPTVHFKAIYHHLGSQLGLSDRQDLVFDASCAHISRACFFSYSPKMYLNKNASPLEIDVATLPEYHAVKNQVAKGPKEEDDEDVQVQPLTDYVEIRRQIQETHTKFEKYFSLYPGVRNNNLFLLAIRFWLGGIPEENAVNYLVAYYACPKDGFGADEIERTVRSAYSR